MAASIMITIGGFRFYGELHDTPAGRAVEKVLPLSAAPNEWGDEFYFEIPVDLPLDGTSTTEVKAGDIGYWPPGRALAIFFGPTPMSTGEDPVPASAVNIAGSVAGDPALLRRAKGAREIRIEKA